MSADITLDKVSIVCICIVVVMMVVLAARFVHEVREMKRQPPEDREEQELEK